jgi:hypothetical protein
MKSITIGYPEFLLVTGGVLYVLSPGSLALTIVCLSIGSAVLRAALVINAKNKEDERKDRDEERISRAEQRVDGVIDQLVKANQYQAAAHYTSIMSGRFNPGDDDGGDGGGYSH